MFERNRTAVQDPAVAKAGDGAAEHAAADWRAAIGECQLQLDGRARQQSMQRLDEDPAG
jgi:hypothetical protein